MLVSSADDIIRIRGYIRHLIRSRTKSGISTSEAIKSLVQSGNLLNQQPNDTKRPTTSIYWKKSEVDLSEQNKSRRSKSPRYGNDYDSYTLPSYSGGVSAVTFDEKSKGKTMPLKKDSKAKEEIIERLKKNKFANTTSRGVLRQGESSQFKADFLKRVDSLKYSKVERVEENPTDHKE